MNLSLSVLTLQLAEPWAYVVPYAKTKPIIVEYVQFKKEVRLKFKYC